MTAKKRHLFPLLVLYSDRTIGFPAKRQKLSKEAKNCKEENFTAAAKGKREEEFPAYQTVGNRSLGNEKNPLAREETKIARQWAEDEYSGGQIF